MPDLIRYLWQSRVMTPLYGTRLKSCFWRDRFHLNTRHLLAPVSLRYGTSDLNVFWQCFVREQYAGCLEWPTPRYILDCGANVGFASAYFLSCFPDSSIISVEPDSGNFAQLTENLKGFGSRAVSIQAAAWSSCESLYLQEDSVRPQNEWGVRVRDRAGDSDAKAQAWVPGFDIPALIRFGRFPKINLLKVDVEGAEERIFSGNCEWLALVDFVAIECHGVVCRDTVARALKRNDFVIYKRGEVYFARKAVAGKK
jgi:FkbM family methyltransferase